MNEMGLRVWVATRIKAARQMANEARRIAEYMQEQEQELATAAQAAQQLATDLDAFADRTEAKLSRVSRTAVDLHDRDRR